MFLSFTTSHMIVTFKKRFSNSKNSKREEQYKEHKLSYVTFFLIYHQWAYYLCCVPYKFVADGNGKYRIHRNKIQIIFSFIQSVIYVYNIFQYSATKWIELVSQRINPTEKGPVSYLGIVEATWYFHFAAIVAYTQLFGGEMALKFLRKLDNYSKKYPLITSKKSTEIFYMLPTQKWFIHILMCIFVVISLLDYSLQYNFNFGNLNPDAEAFIIWRTLNTTESVPGTKTAILVIYIALQTIGNIRVMYNEVYFLAGTVTFWLIGSEFVISVKSITKSLESERKPVQEFKNCVKKYCRINRICRAYNKAYGYAIFSHVASYQMYYAMGIDRLFITSSSLGVKLYELEFLIGFCAIYGLGMGFSHKMSCIKRLVDDKSILDVLTPRKLNFAFYWHKTHYCAIKANTFPLTFSAFNQFVAQIMVVFLIAIQIKMIDANGGGIKPS